MTPIKKLTRIPNLKGMTVDLVESNSLYSEDKEEDVNANKNEKKRRSNKIARVEGKESQEGKKPFLTKYDMEDWQLWEINNCKGNKSKMWHHKPSGSRDNSITLSKETISENKRQFLCVKKGLVD